METPRPVTLVIADDHGIVREGIAAFCADRAEVKVLAQASDGAQALNLILSLQPDFAVLDLNMPRLSGLDVVRRARQAGTATKMIVLSINRDEDVVRELFRSGVSGYLLKDGPARHLFDAINYIRDGGRYLTPLIRRGVVDDAAERPDSLNLLSKRERQIFSFLVDGMRPKDIANVLDISPKTVDTHRASLMRKLEVDGIAALVRFAIARNAIWGPPC